MGHKKVERIDPLSRLCPWAGWTATRIWDDPDFDPDREDVLARARAAGLANVGNVFLGPDDFVARRALFDKHPEVFFLLGIHPCDGRNCTPESLAAMRAAFATEPRLRAVGEIGLDFHWQDCPKELQFKAFTEQLDLARELDAPVVIHCREAEDECLMTLEARGFAGYPLLCTASGAARSGPPHSGQRLAHFRARPGDLPGPMRRCVRPRRSFPRTACCWKPTPPIFHPYPGAASATNRP